MTPFATCFDCVLQAGGEACHASCVDHDCVYGRVRSLVVVLVFVLFRLPVRCVRSGGCTSAKPGGSVAVDRVMFSVAGTLRTVLVCTLGAAWLCCSVG